LEFKNGTADDAKNLVTDETSIRASPPKKVGKNNERRVKPSEPEGGRTQTINFIQKGGRQTGQVEAIAKKCRVGSLARKRKGSSRNGKSGHEVKRTVGRFLL